MKRIKKEDLKKINSVSKAMAWLEIPIAEVFETLDIFLCSECNDMKPRKADSTGLKKCNQCGTINHDRNLHLLD